MALVDNWIRKGKIPANEAASLIQMIETIGQINGQIEMTVSNTEFQAGIKTTEEEISGNMDKLDSLEEIADGRAYHINMGQILDTLAIETPEEEKKTKKWSTKKISNTKKGTSAEGKPGNKATDELEKNTIIESRTKTAKN